MYKFKLWYNRIIFIYLFYFIFLLRKVLSSIVNCNTQIIEEFTLSFTYKLNLDYFFLLPPKRGLEHCQLMIAIKNRYESKKVSLRICGLGRTVAKNGWRQCSKGQLRIRGRDANLPTKLMDIKNDWNYRT